jgi:TPR repeat protein
MRLMAIAYTEGEYFPRDNLAAETCLRKVAELGSDEAKKQLAKLLTNGNGIAQDLEEAFDIYHELMLDCDLDGMVGVGNAYKYGKGVTQDTAKGSFFLKQAFDIELGIMNHEQFMML